MGIENKWNVVKPLNRLKWKVCLCRREKFLKKPFQGSFHAVGTGEST